MSFLSSISSAVPPAPSYHPASLSYLAIFSPSLKPQPVSQEKKNELSEEEWEQRNTSAQLLFYTSRERAVSNQKVSRQLGSATGAIQFAEMLAVEEQNGNQGNGKKSNQQEGNGGIKHSRSWTIHSSKRRLIMVEVMKDLWIHAIEYWAHVSGVYRLNVLPYQSIDLPRTSRSSANLASSESTPASSTSQSETKGSAPNQSKEIGQGSEAEKQEHSKSDYHDEWLRDEWLEGSLRRAWREWRLLNGSPSTLLLSPNGRRALERSLEKFFSVWVWSWDLEAGSGAGASHLNESSGRETFSQSIPAIPVTPLSSNTKISDLIALFETQAPTDLLNFSLDEDEDHSANPIDPPILNDLLVLQDTLLLYPPTSASTTMSRLSGLSAQLSNCDGLQQIHLSSRDRVDLVEHIISHLSGLERERDLVRAAAQASGGGARRKGLGGGTRMDSIGSSKKQGRSSRNAQSRSHSVSIRHGHGASPNKHSNKIIAEGSLKSNREKERANKIREKEREPNWSSWAGVWNSIGRANILGVSSGAESGPLSYNKVEETSQILSQPPRESKLRSNAKDNGEQAPAIKPAGQVGPITEVAEISAPSASAAQSLLSSTSDSKPREEVAPTNSRSQRLGFSDFIPLPDGTGAGRVFSGAEETFKGWGASLGLGTAKEEETPKPETPLEKSAISEGQAPNTLDRASPGQDHGLPQEAQVSSSSDAKATSTSAERKDSHTTPDVDLLQLAEAMGDRTPDQERSLFKTEDQQEIVSKSPESSEPIAGNPEIENLTAYISEADAAPNPTIDQPKVISKPFPSLSVTSAAWYSSRTTNGNSNSSEGSSMKDMSLKGDMASPNIAPSVPATIEDGTDADTHSLKGSVKSGKADYTGVSSGNGNNKNHPLLREQLLLLGHDHELDGWGDEDPLPFNQLKVYIGGGDELITDPDQEECNKACNSKELRILFTTRRLLTVIFVLSTRSPHSGTQPQSMLGEVSQKSERCAFDMASSKLLLPSWNLLRRIQRLANDEMRQLESEAENGFENNVEKTRFLHFSPFESSIQDRLFANPHLMGTDVLAQQSIARPMSALEDEADSEGQLLASREVSKRYPFIAESFSRSNNGRTWTVFSRSKNPAATTSTPAKTHGNLESAPLPLPAVTSETYLLVTGVKPASMNDADHELRRLARDFPSFSL